MDVEARREREREPRGAGRRVRELLPAGAANAAQRGASLVKEQHRAVRSEHRSRVVGDDDAERMRARALPQQPRQARRDGQAPTEPLGFVVAVWQRTRRGRVDRRWVAVRDATRLLGRFLRRGVGARGQGVGVAGSQVAGSQVAGSQVSKASLRAWDVGHGRCTSGEVSSLGMATAGGRECQRSRAAGGAIIDGEGGTAALFGA
eukprot:899581-Prymnesium_polylepis.1